MLRNTLITLSFAFIPLAKAQTPIFQGTIKVSTDGATGVAWLADAITDDLGNSFVIGTFRGTLILGNTSLVSSSPTSDVFIAKLGSSGEWTWASRLGGTSNGLPQSGCAIALDGNGGLYIAAALDSSGLTYNSTPQVAPFPNGICVIKLDTNGEWQWLAGGDLGQNVRAKLAVSGTGEVYVAGDWNAGGGPPVHFGPFQAACGYGTDAFIAKVNAGGTWAWAKTFNSFGQAMEILFDDVALDGSGNVILGGIVHGTSGNIDGQQLTANPLNDPAYAMIPYLAKWAPDGSLIWLSSIGNDHSGGFELEAIVQTEDDRTMVLGLVTDTADLGPHQVIRSATSAPVHTLAVLDANGQWTSAVSSEQWGGWVTDMEQMPDGNLACAGSYSDAASFGGDSLVSAGMSDVFAALMRPTGQWITGVGAGSPNEDQACRINFTQGSIRAFGRFEGPAVFGNDTLNCVSYGCSFISRLDLPAVGLPEWISGGAPQLSIYPVPATDRLNVSIGYHVTTTVYSIIDITGRTVGSGTMQGSISQINVAGLLPGIHVFRTDMGSIRFTKE